MVNERSTSVYSETVDSSKEMPSYQIHTYDIYIQTGCEGKIRNTYCIFTHAGILWHY